MSTVVHVSPTSRHYCIPAMHFPKYSLGMAWGLGVGWGVGRCWDTASVDKLKKENEWLLQVINTESTTLERFHH
jgi:hypothetical protein